MQFGLLDHQIAALNSFFSFLAALWHMEFLGQGSDTSSSCNLGSLTYCARPGIKSVSQCCRDTATEPAAPCSLKF